MPQSSPEAQYSEIQIKSADGLSLALKQWKPSTGEARGHVLLLHGYMEHAGRYRDYAHAVCAANLSVTALDIRGHGRSDGQRGRVDVFEDYLNDLERALEVLPAGPRFLQGHSNGALIALNFAHSRHPKVQGLVVTNPFLAQTQPATGPKLWVALKAGKYLPSLSLPSGLDPAGLSRDPAVGKAYKRDPLVFDKANAAWFREVRHAQSRVRAYTELDMPLLYVYSDADPIASPTANKALSEQIQGRDKTVLMRAGGYHELLNETDKTSLYQAIIDWILPRCAA